uniref:Stan protein n=1 Tax=Fopius arisanus TaxID=64838 RepID=A0A0C9R2N1_9HYME
MNLGKIMPFVDFFFLRIQVTVVGTRVLQGVRAIDADQPGPYSTVQYAVLPGLHSDYFVFINALEGTLVLRKPLDYETLNNFSVNIRAQDQGNPPQSSITTLSVNVIDADDQNPVFLYDQYSIIIPETVRNRKVLVISPGAIEARDQDAGINAPIKYTIQGGILPFLSLNSQTGEISLARPLMDHELSTAVTMVIKATQIDNPDRYSLATVMVSREDGRESSPGAGGNLPVKFVLKNFIASVSENTPPGSIILTTGVNKIDPKLRFHLDGAPEELERFSITHSGDLLLKEPLDYEKKILHSFVIHVSDGTNNDTARVNISVQDVNEWEPRFRHPRYEFHARTLRVGSIVGRLEAADGDRGDRVSLSLRGPDARLFEIRDNGELILTSTGPFNGSLARLVAVASDTGKPPRTSMIPLIVHIPPNARSPIAARAAPAWLNGSILLVAVFGVVLGLLGVVILILILYIYKQKRPKNSGSVNSIGTGYRGKSPVPSALSSSPQILGATALHEENSKNSTRRQRGTKNPVFGEDNENPYNAGSIQDNRQIPSYGRHKVAPMPITPSLSATSNIPNIGGLVQNMNDLSARMNLDTVSQNSSNYSGDPPDSLIPAWPPDDSRHVKKLSWNDDSRTGDSVDTMGPDQRTENTHPGPDKLNLTVYF